MGGKAAFATYRFGNEWRALGASALQTLTTRPPSSTQRKHNWVSRAQRSCSSTSCCPSRRFAAPDRGSLCIWRPVLVSGSCSVYPRVEWGWFCVKTRRLRWATVSFASPWRWPGTAGSATPRRTDCCLDSFFCPVSRNPDCCPRSTFYCVSSSFQIFSVACPTHPHWSVGYPLGRRENLSPLPFLVKRNARIAKKKRSPLLKLWLQNISEYADTYRKKF